MRKGISIVLGSLIGAVCIQVTYIACGTPSTANAQDAALLARVASLESLVTLLQARPTYGRYCGSTATASNGGIGSAAAKDGYRRAQQACAQAAGCGASARMCSAAEMTLSAQNAAGPISGSYWVALGASIQTTPPSTDCGGWQQANGGFAGIAWSGDSQSATVSTCDMSNKIACCD